jgi:DNA primase
MPSIDYAAARQALPIADVPRLLDWQAVTRRGLQARGPCFLHGSRSPRSRSLAVHLGKNLYRCFSCGAGGNALDLWSAHTRQPLHAAVIDLCQRLGVSVPLARRASKEKERPMPP